MADSFSSIEVTRKSGQERFRYEEAEVDFSLAEFWQWMGSDLVSNAMRGVLAEYIVAQALDVADGVRVEWDAYDLVSRDGFRIEVKSASYHQSWAQQKPSKIEFSVAPKRGWDPKTNESAVEATRPADIYVFCVLKHEDRDTLDPLRLEQWDFYVLPTKTLDEQLLKQKKIGLSKLLRLEPVKATFATLPAAIEATTTGSEPM